MTNIKKTKVSWALVHTVLWWSNHNASRETRNDLILFYLVNFFVNDFYEQIVWSLVNYQEANIFFVILSIWCLLSLPARHEAQTFFFFSQRSGVPFRKLYIKVKFILVIFSTHVQRWHVVLVVHLTSDNEKVKDSIEYLSHPKTLYSEIFRNECNWYIELFFYEESLLYGWYMYIN